MTLFDYLGGDYATLENMWRAFAVLAFLWLLHYLQERQGRIQRAAGLQIHAAKKFKERNIKRQLMHEMMTKEDKYTLPDAERRVFLLSLTASELHHHMHVVGDVSCVEVVLLYSLRAMAVGALTNAVTEEFYTEALKQAAVVDATIAARKAGEDDSTPGIMEGIPISVKDAFEQKSADNSCGFAARAFRPLSEDGLIVSLLRDAGAIPFVRTNVPQGLMVPESMNVTWGVSLNPWNLERTPGGSSGGEGALLAARGSPLGIGSDIGGSLRIPAHFCGLYSLKPTPGRLTLSGLGMPCPPELAGNISVRPVAGPMGHNVADLTLVMRAWLSPRMWAEDAFIPRMPLDDEAIKGSKGPATLKIAYYETDGWFAPAPACARAVRQAVAALQEAGHECVRWVPPQVPQAVRIYYGLQSADSAASILAGLEGEEVHENYKDLLRMLSVPSILKGLIVSILRSDRVGQLRAALMVQAISPKSSALLFQFQAAMLEYLSSFTAAWQAQGFDALVCPGLGLPALKHGGSKELTLACSYTFLYNVLHYPVGSVPIGLTEDHELVYEEPAGQPRDMFTTAAANTVQGSKGLPVGVQVVALPYQDEMVLRVMTVLEKKIRFKEIPDMADKLKI